MDKFLTAYLVDGAGSKIALIKVPFLLDGGLPDFPRHVKVVDKYAYVSNTSPLTYNWIEDPLEAEIVKEY
jgi:hypothetical protein